MKERDALEVPGGGFCPWQDSISKNVSQRTLRSAATGDAFWKLSSTLYGYVFKSRSASKPRTGNSTDKMGMDSSLFC